MLFFKTFLIVVIRKHDGRAQGCQIVVGTTYQNGKNMPNDH
jgi:hypothetical protein